MAERYERYKRAERNTVLPSALKKAAPRPITPKVTYDPAKQVEGYKTRLEGSDIDAEKALDKRNFVEKGLNLTEDQNFFFDIFEVLGRPQQALFNGIKSLQEGNSFGEGFKKGLTGKEYVNFSNILNEAGMGEADSFGLDDVLGFAGDVFLDPADLTLLAAGTIAAPLTGGASLAGATTAVTAMNTTDNIIDATKSLGKIAKEAMGRIATKIGDSAKATGKMYKELGSQILKNPLKGVGAVFSSKPLVLGSGEKIIKTSVTNITMAQFKNVAKHGGHAINMAIRTGLGGDASTATKIFDDALKAMQGWMDKAARLGDEQLTKVKGWISKKSGFRVYGDAWVQSIKNDISKIADDIYDKSVKEAQATGQVFTKTKEEIMESVNKSLAEYGELNYSPETTLSEVLSNPYKWELPIDGDIRTKLVETINKPAFKDLKVAIENSPRREMFYKNNIGELKFGVKKEINNSLNQIKTEMDAIKATVQTPVAAGDVAKQFIDGVQGKKPIEDLTKIVQQPKGTPSAPASQPVDIRKVVSDFSAGVQGKEGLDSIVGKVQSGLNGQNTAAAAVLSPDQAKRLAELETLSKKLSDALTMVDSTVSDYKTIDVLKQQMRDIANSTESKEIVQLVESMIGKFEKNLADESLNLFDELYVKTALENGKEIYVLRHDLDAEGNSIVDATLKKIEKRFTELFDIVDDATYKNFKSTSRFVQGSSSEGQLRRFIEKLDNGKTFEDYFKFNDQTGLWSLRNKSTKIELLNYMRKDELMEAPVKAARFRTDQEWEALKTKYAAGFEYEDNFKAILDRTDSAMRWIDEKYATTMKQDVKGYIHHAATKEAKDALNVEFGYKQFKADKKVLEDTPFIIGNTKSFASRKYMMSIEEANMVARFNAERMVKAHEDGLYKLSDGDLAFWKEKENIDLFSEYFTDSFADTLIKMNDYGAAINIMDTALVKSTFLDKDVVRKVESIDLQKPASTGFKRVPKDLVASKLKAMSSVYPDNKQMKEFVKEFLSGDSKIIEIDKNVWDMIGRIGDESNTGLKLMQKILDSSNRMFKKLKVFSFGFHAKNLMGNASNLYLAGVNPASLPKMLIGGVASAKKGKALMQTFVEGGEEAIKLLSKKDQDIWRAYKMFVDAGFQDAGKYLYDLDNLFGDNREYALSAAEHAAEAKSAFKNKKIVKGSKESLDTLLQLNVQANEIVDNGYRLGYIQKLMKDGLSEEEIITKVKQTLLDPSDLTAAEKDVAKRLIPFYTFAKKNLAFQFKNVFENPVRYKRFIKSVRGTWDLAGVDYDEELQTYQKENMWIPIPLTMKDGKYIQLRTSFPMSDLAEFTQSPVKKILSSMAPYIKAPFELTQNKEIYSGLEIERFEGQEGRNLPFMSAKSEFLLGQTGMDRLIAPAKNVYDVLKNNKGVAGAFPTVVSQGSVEAAKTSKAYDELNQLRDLMSYYKQEEIPILTLSEIQNVNKPRASLADRLRAIQERSGR